MASKVYGKVQEESKEGSDRYREAALKAGEDLWKRGILLKGNGVCHGITGNAYALFTLYRYTKDEIWLKRAYRFTLATFDEEIQSLCKGYEDPQRITKGVPDTPFSLMEGVGGDISLYCDILEGEDSEGFRFPGYEII